MIAMIADRRLTVLMGIVGGTEPSISRENSINSFDDRYSIVVAFNIIPTIRRELCESITSHAVTVYKR
jgi:hypothetical protein